MKVSDSHCLIARLIPNNKSNYIENNTLVQERWIFGVPKRYTEGMDMQMIVQVIADGLVVPVVLIGAYVLLRHVPSGQRYAVYSRVLMAGLTSYVAAKIIGLLYQPATLRPFELLGVEAGASFLNNPGFPSDHALFTMAITLAILFGAKHRWWALVALTMTLLVCVGRVVALVHTPLDVIGGIVIACVGVVWYLPIQVRSKQKSVKPRAS